MNCDFKKGFEDRIKDIDKQISEAAQNKKWVEVAKLEAKKVELQEKIER
ncbi:hypothetical protein B0P06_005286 [Clostridium saccharoperbutylacetonicum]|uniref:Uncharacterized protein n=1 Tax=Clostridium saccharoperbutylacetonicum N1-4(HMT) TaxID=931276 RepID=M1MNZ0_9CLOT|nr:hypothetical protein [Clostridium saccharoperbutylacetonicum]AGF56446.1 hypothetical protein Cspa_c26810 [Clostridium saccharoperbutylacetonicum N1-4(HMT)]NRT62807.1 hypothetical protein [Clostridium saccharoperbutylacetonicum]NSB26161.1 hypothetical protein [Clostridium saccharoperbutylacetonicum]NSB45515.1 hypothetical protein [Clostridium saccharoperbutylacetonicum]